MLLHSQCTFMRQLSGVQCLYVEMSPHVISQCSSLGTGALPTWPRVDGANQKKRRAKRRRKAREEK